MVFDALFWRKKVVLANLGNRYSDLWPNKRLWDTPLKLVGGNLEQIFASDPKKKI